MKSRGKRKILFIRKEILFVYLFMIGIIVVDLAIGASYGRIYRALWGVKDGVTLAGVSVDGKLRDEVRTIVEQISGDYERDPIPAMACSETGEVVAGAPGTSVDVEATVEKVMRAKPGEDVELVTAEVLPTITIDYFTPVYAVNTEQKAVSFAINVAWGEKYLPDMLACLKENKIKTTFFFVGTWVKKFPDIVKRISDEGHEIANHGYSHIHVGQISQNEVSEAIKSNDNLLKDITGNKKISLFSPPYGELNQSVVAAAGGLGYRTIMWSIDTIDWKRPPASEIRNRVMSKLKEGAIILMHPTKPTTDALPALIRDIQSKGYRIVPVSELLKVGEPVDPRSL